MVPAVVAYVVLAGLAVFQIALAAGAPLGRLAWGATPGADPAGLGVGRAGWVLLSAALARPPGGPAGRPMAAAHHAPPPPPARGVLPVSPALQSEEHPPNPHPPV